MNGNLLTKEDINDYLVIENDKLLPFPDDYDYYSSIQSLLSLFKSSHIINIQLIDSSITDLRRLLKYHDKLFYVLFDSLHTIFLQRCITNQIILNALLLLYEIYIKDKDYINWNRVLLSELMRIVNEYSFEDNNRVKVLIKMVLNLIANNGFSHNLFALIISFLDSKKEEIVIYASEMLYNIIIHLDISISVYMIEWDNLVIQCCNCSKLQYNHIIHKLYNDIKSWYSISYWNEILYSLDIKTLEMLKIIDKSDISIILDKKLILDDRLLLRSKEETFNSNLYQ